MRHFTTPDQTAKLIELGFEKPKSLHNCELAYNIGELIEILPPAIEYVIWWGEELGEIGVWGLRIDSGGTAFGWDVSYERPNSAHAYREGRQEMVDALFDMIVTLKEEGMI